ncbi:ArdC family protein [Hyphomicrobium sp. MC8b]|uniref:ArdC family protein n=1 Tax=Hyphomicrobium sp. MC8b TaxID=300273 RepID=UPI0039189135
MPANENRPDVYTRITDKIVTALEQGARPWTQPWNAEHLAGRITRPRRATGEAYRGINVIMLWMEAYERGYAAPVWMTFRQALALEAHVRKGEKGSLVVYANKITRTEQDANGDDYELEIPFLKGYTVFNVEQIEGLPAHYYAKQEPAAPITAVDRVAHADTFLESTGASVVHGGNVASYNVGTDLIRMPPIDTFRDAPSYYAVRAHETIHWTRHKSRLDRSFGREKWGDEGYAREELVAELGSAFICADLDLTPEIRDDHAAYIASWIKVLQNDKRAVFQAAAHAQRAADYLHNLQPGAAAKAA